MVSKVIKEERERQQLFLKMKATPSTTIACHRHSLDNLKRYLKDALKQLSKDFSLNSGAYFDTLEDQFKEDIKELTKMIRKYDVLKGADE